MPKFLKKALIVLGVIIAALAAYMTYSSTLSPVTSSKINQNGLEISVDYCQPSKKNRVIFGDLLPYGQVWRTGANAATVIKFNKDVLIAGQPLKSGAYTLWSIPNEKEFTIIFNSETGQWGTNYDETKDVLKVNVPSSQEANIQELFQIGLVGVDSLVNLTLNWDKTKVIVPIR